MSNLVESYLDREIWRGAVIWLPDMRPAAKIVLHALAVYWNVSEKIARPSMAELGWATGYDERTVSRRLNEGRHFGFVSWESTAGRTANVYQLLLPDAANQFVAMRKERWEAARHPRKPANPGTTTGVEPRTTTANPGTTTGVEPQTTTANSGTTTGVEDANPGNLDTQPRHSCVIRTYEPLSSDFTLVKSEERDSSTRAREAVTGGAEVRSEARRAQPNWNGCEGPLVSKIGAREFGLWFAGTLVLETVPFRLLVRNKGAQVSIEQRFGKLLKQLYGKYTIEVTTTGHPNQDPVQVVSDAPPPPVCERWWNRD